MDEQQRGRVRGRIGESAPGEWYWYCWRPTGKTISGVAADRQAALRELKLAMEALGR